MTDNNDTQTTFNPMQSVKREFFAMRNGVLADVLRSAGAPYRIIFGLNLPQITEIANRVGVNDEMACALWANDTTRESRLIAPMMMDAENMDMERARAMVLDMKGVEEIDVACMKLFSKLPFRRQLVDQFVDSDNDLQRYFAMRMLANMMYAEPDYCEAPARAELARDNSLTNRLARMIVDEIEFMREG
jgi:hypothetical protein